MALTTMDPRSALVVIDLQKGIVPAREEDAPVDPVVRRSARLATAFRRHGLPVVLVNVTGRAPGRTDARGSGGAGGGGAGGGGAGGSGAGGGGAGGSGAGGGGAGGSGAGGGGAGGSGAGGGAAAFPPGWSDLVDELDVRPTDHLITKRRRSAFHDTGLDTLLRDLGVTQVVLAGISTSSGVESTARAAFDHGYHVVLATDAMSDPDTDAHRNSVERVFPKTGETATTSEITDMMEGTR